MDKEALTSVGLIGMLLVIVIAATVINSQQQLVATRPQIDSVVSNTLENFLGIEHETEESLKAQAGETTCPLGCTAKTVASPAPEREEQLQSDPIPYVRDQVGEQHATQLQSGELESIYNTDSDLWWRSSEGYRIRTTGAKRVTFQLPTTAVAYTRYSVLCWTDGAPSDAPRGAPPRRWAPPLSDTDCQSSVRSSPPRVDPR